MSFTGRRDSGGSLRPTTYPGLPPRPSGSLVPSSYFAWGLLAKQPGVVPLLLCKPGSPACWPDQVPLRDSPSQSSRLEDEV